MSDRTELEELRRLDELERKAAGEVPQQSAPAAPTEAPKPTNTFGQEAGRQGGMFLRNALTALGSVGAIPADAIGKAVNYVAGKEVVPNQRRALQHTLTSMGLPEPAADRPIEQFGQGMAESAPAFAIPGGFVPQVLGNAAIGAAQAGQGQELNQALWGGGAGAVGSALGRVAGGIVRPTAAARELMDAGVALTPGQAAGAGSFVKRAEEAAASLPVAGHAIRGAQRRAVQDANVAAAQSVMNMVDHNTRLGLPPREAIEQTRDAIGRSYESGLSGMSAPAAVTQAHLGLRLQDLPNEFPMVPESDFHQMWTFVSDRLGNAARNRGGMFTGTDLKQLDSEIGQYVRNLYRSPVAADKTAAPAWRQLQQSLREVMEMGQPDAARLQQLQDANAAYRQLLALEKALLPGADSFTPRRLGAALDRSEIINGELRNISNAMNATLPNTVPDSGTAERLLTAGLPAMLMGGGAGAQSMGWDTLGTGMMAAGALGSRPGTRFMTGGYGLQQALAEALRRGVPSAVRAGARDD